MLVAACPNCGAEIRFRSTALPVKVCDFCRSAVLRTGDNLLAMGKIASVPDDVSPLQIGTRGQVDSIGFELVGRVRWRWSDGAWSEWFVLFDDGSTGWLGEATGRFMLLREIPSDSKMVQRLLDCAAIKVGQQIRVDGTTFVANDVRTATCVGSEGELPISAPAGLEMLTIDLVSNDGACACLQKDRGSVATYVGRYVTLAELAPVGLRAMEGWSIPSFGR